MRPLLASLTAALLLSTAPALASPADDFVADLKTLGERNDATITVGATEERVDGFVLENMTITGEAATGKVAETEVVGYEKTSTGSAADRVTSKGIAVPIANNDVTVTMDELVTTDLAFPENALTTASMFSLYGSQAITNMVVKLAGLTIVEVAGSTVNTSRGADGVYTSNTTVDGIMVDLGNLPMGGSSNAVAELGYERLNAKVSGMATYDPADGTFESTDTQVVVENAATIGMAYRPDGLHRTVRATDGRVEQNRR